MAKGNSRSPASTVSTTSLRNALTASQKSSSAPLFTSPVGPQVTKELVNNVPQQKQPATVGLFQPSQAPFTVPGNHSAPAARQVRLVVKETPSSASGKGESGSWTQVKEKRRPSARLGAKATSTLRTVIPRWSVIVFATRFSPDVSVDDVKEVLQDSFTDVGSIEKLASKHASYASFKVTLSFEGISFRATGSLD